MRDEILRRVASQAPGEAVEPWPAVIGAAEVSVAARIPGSLRHDHQPDRDPRIMVPIVPAAVLVPIVARAGGMTVLLTRRNEALARHAGQISFPGGRRDPEDETPAQTALREAEEEVGLTRADVEVAGRLDDYLVGTGFRITPVVGIVAPGARIEPNASEVAEVFEVPLAFALERANYRREEMTIQGFSRRFHVLTFEGYRVWGATAAILVNLREVIAPS